MRRYVRNWVYRVVSTELGPVGDWTWGQREVYRDTKLMTGDSVWPLGKTVVYQ